MRWVYFFGDGSAEGDPARKDLLGGKGASLAAMSRAGLPVPPGFTISVEACELYHRSGGAWPDGLADEVRRYVRRLAEATGKEFGRSASPASLAASPASSASSPASPAASPLLVSVRSGAAVSMPGMMDTILNCGMSPDQAEETPDRQRFWLVYQQFVRQFARSVAGLDQELFDQAVKQAASEQSASGQAASSQAASEQSASGQAAAEACIRVYEQRTGKAFPRRPWDALTQCINAVFDSWNSERAIVYRKAHDIRGLAGTAVNVQAMFNSQVSGVAFTANPSDPQARQVIVEGAFGLGESVVSGDVTPDRFVIDRDRMEITHKAISNKGHVVTAMADPANQSAPAAPAGTSAPADPADPNAACLGDDDVLAVAAIALKVEEYFGYPVDIEWGLADGHMALLQSRAVRGLDIAADVEPGRLEEIARLRKRWGNRQKVWVMHNLAETLLAPTPLTWDVMGHFMSPDGGFGMMYRDFGYKASREARRNGFLDLICGKIYVDPDMAAGVFWGNMPFEYDHQEILKDPTVLETAPTRFNAARADGKFFLQLPGAVLAMIRSARTIKRARRQAKDRFDNRILPDYLSYIDHLRAMDLDAMPTGEVVAELRDRITRVMRDFGKESLKPGFFGGLASAQAEALLVQLMGEQKGRTANLELTSGLEGDTTIEQNIMLYRVATGDVDISEFIDRFGHRTTGEMELSQPRWREDSSYPLRMIEYYRGSPAANPEDLHAEKVRLRRRAVADLPGRLAECGGGFLLEKINRLIVEAQQLLPYREVGKHYLMMGYEQIRLAVEQLARRWDIGRDIYFLHLDELDSFEAERDRLLAEIRKRKVRWQSAQRLEMQSIITSDRLDEIGVGQEIVASTDMDAVPLAAGVAVGRARIVFSPQEALTPGDSAGADAAAGDAAGPCVLVCPSTDPGWTAVFPSIKALVVERGGVLSHGAITARDFGIPAVACPDATRRIPAGATVRVDGDHGKVQIIQEDRP